MKLSLRNIHQNIVEKLKLNRLIFDVKTRHKGAIVAARAPLVLTDALRHNFTLFIVRHTLVFSVLIRDH